MVESRKRRTEEHKLLMASFRIRKDFVRACSNASPSAAKVFWAVVGSQRFQSRKEPSEVFGERSTRAIGFALTLRVRRANLDRLWSDRHAEKVFIGTHCSSRAIESTGLGFASQIRWERGEGIQRRERAGDFPIARRHLNQCNGFSRVRKVIHTRARDVPNLTDNRNFFDLSRP